ncbi:MAG: T9SS type A sorting domain-containing protein [Bacteroidetes bacterium]|nr:T9SS type A sorting domain-containing protein [Bacteroidota bacterium]
MDSSQLQNFRFGIRQGLLTFLLSLSLTRIHAQNEFHYRFHYTWNYSFSSGQLSAVRVVCEYRAGSTVHGKDSFLVGGALNASSRLLVLKGTMPNPKIDEFHFTLKNPGTGAVLSQWQSSSSYYNSNPALCNGYAVSGLFSGNNCVTTGSGAGVLCGSLEFNFFSPGTDDQVKWIYGYSSYNNAVYCESDALSLIAPCLFTYRNAGAEVRWYEADSSGKNFVWIGSGDTLRMGALAFRSGRPVYNYPRYYKAVVDSTDINGVCAGGCESLVAGPVVFYLGKKPWKTEVVKPACPGVEGNILLHFDHSERYAVKQAPRVFVTRFAADGRKETRYSMGYCGESPVALNGRTAGADDTARFGNLPRRLSLLPGKYEIMTDFSPWNGYDCKFFRDTVIVPENTDTAILNTTVYPNVCAGDREGVIEVQHKGGVPVTEYWLDMGKSLSGSRFAGLPGGYYVLFYKIILGCTVRYAGGKPIVVDEPPAFSAFNLWRKTAECAFGGKTGALLTGVAGGRPGDMYHYSLDGSRYFPAGDTLRNLPGGIYSIMVQNNRHCTVVYRDTVFSNAGFSPFPSALVPPLCAGTNTGSLLLSVQNPVMGDIYQVSVNGTQWYPLSDTLRGIGDGRLTLYVKNQKGCVATGSIQVQAVNRFTYVLNTDTTLCTGQKLILFPLQKGAVSGTISGPAGMQPLKDTLILGKPGDWVLNVRDINGCSATDTVKIAWQNQTIHHDFLIPDMAFVSDSVYTVNISKPAGDVYDWKLFSGAVRTEKRKHHTAALYFSDTGKFTIGLHSRYGKCGYYLEKPIRIFGAGDSSGIKSGLGYRGPLIQDFYVTPNPNDGVNFSIIVKLRDTANIVIYKLHSTSGDIVGEYEAYRKKYYNIKAFNASEAGVYYLKLLAGTESKTIKVVIVK